jgi:hypothetical protein
MESHYHHLLSSILHGAVYISSPAFGTKPAAHQEKAHARYDALVAELEKVRIHIK